MRIEKFILRFFLIILPLIPLLFFLGKFDNLDYKWTNNIDIIRLEQKKNFNDLDILFVGGSYCYSGIYPKICDSIGLKTYNLGIASAGPYYYELIINDYLAASKNKPKSIFVLISPMTFASIADNFTAYPIHRYLQRSLSNEDVVFKYNRFTNDYFYLTKKSIAKGITNILIPAKKIPQKEIDEVIMNKGFLGSEIVNSKDIEASIKRFYTPLKKEKFNKNKFSYLLRYADSLKSQGVKVIFYELPTNTLNEYFNMSYLEEYNHYSEILNTSFICFRNEKKLDNNCFRNFDHLNSKGAIQATRNLLEQIKNNQELMSLYKLK